MNPRRALLGAAAGAALAARLPAGAQGSGKVYRIGWLGYTAANTPDDERIVAAFVQRLRELGFSEGANLAIEWRYAEGRNERYPELAAELVRLGADVIVVGSGAAARAVMAASRSVPIVTFAVPDPVRAGLAASLAHPGGQVTGLYNLSDELVPKRLELLKTAVPGATDRARPLPALPADRRPERGRTRRTCRRADRRCACARGQADDAASADDGAIPRIRCCAVLRPRVLRVVDLKVARSMGLGIPQSLLLRADEVIE
jgi:hypothetical protein